MSKPNRLYAFLTVVIAASGLAILAFIPIPALLGWATYEWLPRGSGGRFHWLVLLGASSSGLPPASLVAFQAARRSMTAIRAERVTAGILVLPIALLAAFSPGTVIAAAWGAFLFIAALAGELRDGPPHRRIGLAVVWTLLALMIGLVAASIVSGYAFVYLWLATIAGIIVHSAVVPSRREGARRRSVATGVPVIRW